jgi:hypothetical protein
MADSDDNSTSTESNDPRTPAPQPRPQITARVLTAPSKLPKLKSSPNRFPFSPSHLQTQSSPVVPTTPLDWGEDWSRLSEEIKKRSPAVDMSSRPSAEQDSLFEAEECDDDEVLPKVALIPVEEATRALQSAISFEAAFDQAQKGEKVDAEQSTASLSATSEGQEHETVAIPQPSTPEHVVGAVRDRRSTQAEREDHLVELGEAVAMVVTFDTIAKRNDPDFRRSLQSLGSVLERSPAILGYTLKSSFRAPKSTKNATIPSSHTERLAATTFRSPAGTARVAKPKTNTDEPSSQIRLRGLIRGAHREMKYLTLSHEGFSLDDLRQGLGFAFSMLQAAHSKLAILAVLHDMTDPSAANLRSWLTQIDHIRPQTRHEPRMFVMFESLSSGEIRVALAEVVQSRLIVEDEVKQKEASLTKRFKQLESNEKSSMWLVAWVESLQNEHAGTAEGLLGEDEAEWDAIFTAVMAVMVVGFYLCVRE